MLQKKTYPTFCVTECSKSSHHAIQVFVVFSTTFNIRLLFIVTHFCICWYEFPSEGMQDKYRVQLYTLVERAGLVNKQKAFVQLKLLQKNVSM